MNKGLIKNRSNSAQEHQPAQGNLHVETRLPISHSSHSVVVKETADPDGTPSSPPTITHRVCSYLLRLAHDVLVSLIVVAILTGPTAAVVLFNSSEDALLRWIPETEQLAKYGTWMTYIDITLIVTLICGYFYMSHKVKREKLAVRNSESRVNDFQMRNTELETEARASKQHTEDLNVKIEELKAELVSRPAGKAAVHGKRMALTYKTDEDNISIITRRYEEISTSEPPLVLPYQLTFSEPVGAEIQEVKIRSSDGARFREPWDLVPKRSWSTAIEFCGKNKSPCNVEVEAKVKNAFARDAATASKRLRSNLDLGRDFQQWDIGQTLWDELTIDMIWPEDRKLSDPILMIADSVEVVDTGAFRIIPPNSYQNETSNSQIAWYADKTHWTIRIRNVTQPSSVYLHWKVE